MKCTIALNGPQIQNILECAVRCNAPVRIEPTGEEGRRIHGQFVSCDDEVLVVVLDDPPQARNRLIGRYADVHVLGEQEYAFSTDILDDGGPQEPRQVVLRRPQALEVLQRRRISRTRLAPSSTVELTWNEKRQKRSCAAALLNISPDGMACRVAPGPAPDLPIGRMIEVRFELPTASQAFQIRASIRNNARGEDDASLLGIQFELRSGDPADERMKRELADCLYRRTQALREMEEAK